MALWLIWHQRLVHSLWYRWYREGIDHMDWFNSNNCHANREIVTNFDTWLSLVLITGTLLMRLSQFWHSNLFGIDDHHTDYKIWILAHGIIWYQHCHIDYELVTHFEILLVQTNKSDFCHWNHAGLTRVCFWFFQEIIFAEKLIFIRQNRLVTINGYNWMTNIFLTGWSIIDRSLLDEDWSTKWHLLSITERCSNPTGARVSYHRHDCLHSWWSRKRTNSLRIRSLLPSITLKIVWQPSLKFSLIVIDEIIPYESWR